AARSGRRASRGTTSQVKCRRARTVPSGPAGFVRAAAKREGAASLIRPLGGVHVLDLEWLLVQHRLGPHALELPGRHVRKVLVVAQRLAVGRLALFAEVPTARLGPV